MSNPTKLCDACQQRRDNCQAAGVVVFFVSLLSCGMLMVITYPLTLFLVVRSTRHCPACRAQLALVKVKME